MNFQTKSPKELPVDVPLVKNLLVRLMTSADQGMERINKQQILMKNLETLNMSPEAHLAMVMKAMEKLQSEDKPPVYETGLIFGVALCLTARSANGRRMLRRMLSDIELQQGIQTPLENQPENPIQNLNDPTCNEIPLPTLTAFPDPEVTS